jgi:hypothetical protein
VQPQDRIEEEETAEAHFVRIEWTAQPPDERCLDAAGETRLMQHAAEAPVERAVVLDRRGDRRGIRQRVARGRRCGKGRGCERHCRDGEGWRQDRRTTRPALFVVHGDPLCVDRS